MFTACMTFLSGRTKTPYNRKRHAVSNSLPARSVERSYELYREALEIIPGGVQLISRRPQLYALGMTPPYVSRGKGSRFWDLDGNEYIDFMMCVGASILGYADDAIDEA